jgi:hypothetical protein
MSAAGFLTLYRQDDGDIVVTVAESNETGKITGTATVEFCTRAGGGGSPKTLRALYILMKAMAEDTLDPESQGRRHRRADDAMAQRIVQYMSEVEQCEAEQQYATVVTKLLAIMRAARHLLMAAKGPENSPENWDETRARLFEHMDEFDDEKNPAKS